MPVMFFVWIFIFFVAGNAVTVLGKGSTTGEPEMHSEVGDDIFLPHSYYVKLQNEKKHENETALRAVEVDYFNVDGSVEIADVIPDDRRGIRVSSQGVLKTNGKSIRKHNITIFRHEQVQKTYYPLESDEWRPTIKDDVKSVASNNENTSQANEQGRNSHNHKRSVTELTRTKRSTWSKLMSPISRHTPIRSYRKTKRSKSERRPRSSRPGNFKAIHKRGASRKLAQNVDFRRRRPAEESAFTFRSKNNSSRRKNIKKLNKKRTSAKRSGTKSVHSRRGDIKTRSSRPKDRKSATRANTSQKVVHIKPQRPKLHARRLEDITPFHEVKKPVRTDSITHRKSVKNANVNFRTNNANSTKETNIRSKRKPGGRIKNSIASNSSSNAQVKSKDQKNKADHRQFDDTKKATLKSADTKSVQKGKPPVEKKKNAKETKKHNNTQDGDSGKRKDKALKKDIPLQRKPDEKKSNNTPIGKGSNNASGKDVPLQNKPSGKILNNTDVDNSSNNESKKEAPLQGKPKGKKLNTATDNKNNNTSNKKDPLPRKPHEKKLNFTAVDDSSNNGSKKKAPLQGKLNGKKLNKTVTNKNSSNASNKTDSLPRKPDKMKLSSTAIDNSSNNTTKDAASLQRKTGEKKLNKLAIDNTSDNKSMEATKTENRTKSGDRNSQKVKINDTDLQGLYKSNSGDRQKLNKDVANTTTVDNSVAKTKTTKQKHTKEYNADTLKSNSSNTSDLKAHESNLTTDENIKHKSNPRPGARRSGFVGVYDARHSIITKKFKDLKKRNNTKPISNTQDIKTQNKQRHSNNVDRTTGDIENHESVKLAAKRIGTEGAHGNNVATAKSRSKEINKTRRKHRPYSNNSLNFRTNSYNSVSKKRNRNKNGKTAGSKPLTRSNAGIKNKRITKGHHKLSRKSTIHFRTANSKSLDSKNIKNRNIRDQGVKTVKMENVKNERIEKKGATKQVGLNDFDSGDHKSVNLKHSDRKSANETINKYNSSLHESGASVKHQQDPLRSKADKSVKKHRPHSNVVSKKIHARDNQPLEPKNSRKLVLQRLSSKTHQGEGSKKPNQRSQNIKLVNKSTKSRGQGRKTRIPGRTKTMSKPKRAKAKKEKNHNEPMFRFLDEIEDEYGEASERALPTINKKEEKESANMQILNNDLKLYGEPALYKVKHMNRGNLFEPNNLKPNQYSNTINERNHGNDPPCLLQKLNSSSGEKCAKNYESNLPNRQDLNISREVRLKTSIPFPKTLKTSFMEKVSNTEHGQPTIINFQNGTEYNVSNVTKTRHSPGGDGQQQVDESIVNTVSKSYSILQIASVDPIPKEYLKMILGQ